jgi:molybdate transport system substrate-binding protein
MISRRSALALALAIPLGLPAAAQEAPVIAAASDLQFALDEIAAQFRADTGQEVQITYGSTGNFARQIREGAPFQMFLAADETFVLDLAREGLTRDQGTLYAEGRLALTVPEGSAVTADGALEGLTRALAEGRVSRFAIANPEHAPYGKRAEEALRHAGLWQAITPHLVLGENVSQAAQFALSGNAEGGIVAYSLALSPALSAKGQSALIPADWHSPLLQRMVLMRDAGPVAEAFYTYMASPGARAIMQRYGFTLPQG